jgi:hypothetical protein
MPRSKGSTYPTVVQASDGQLPRPFHRVRWLDLAIPEDDSALLVSSIALPTLVLML